MNKTYYLSKGNAPCRLVRDQAGGLPSHLPQEFPMSSFFCKPMCFIFQLYSHVYRFPLPEILCLQVYQSGEIDDGDDPTPVVITLPKCAPLNTEKRDVPAQECKLLRYYGMVRMMNLLHGRNQKGLLAKL